VQNTLTLSEATFALDKASLKCLLFHNMRITRWGEYGILCCLYLAIAERKAASGVKNSSEASSIPGATVGAAEIAENQGIPTQYAQQILHRLRKGGVINSVRGPKGGFLLARPATEISLHQILTAAEGHTFELICDSDPVHEQACMHAESCGLRTIWEELQSTINTFLTNRSLAAILDIHPSIIGSGGFGLVSGPHRKAALTSTSEAVSASTAAGATVSAPVGAVRGGK
jgi:Rrf2 family iron-sulfur cluster assembly transcriptional regulator